MSSELIIRSGQRMTVQPTQQYQYQLMNTQSVFILKGHLLLGAEYQYAILSFILINLPTLIFYLTILSQYQYYFIILAFLLLHICHLCLFVMAACIDPGIIPKNLDKMQPERSSYDIPYKEKEVFELIRTQKVLQSHMDIVNEKGFLLRNKLCRTCGIYRPARCSHCPTCDNCVEKFDHHCPWLGTCIGKRNYHYFYGFIGTLFMIIVFQLTLIIHYMVVKTNEYVDLQESKIHHQAFAQMLEHNPFTIILLIFITPFFIFLISLQSFHTFLVITQQTTNEYLKQSWTLAAGNPFRLDVITNIINALFNPNKKSRLNIYGKYYELLNDDLSEINTSINDKQRSDIKIKKDFLSSNVFQRKISMKSFQLEENNKLEVSINDINLSIIKRNDGKQYSNLNEQAGKEKENEYSQSFVQNSSTHLQYEIISQSF